MKAFEKMVCAVSLLFAAIFIFANLIMLHWNIPENGRPYRVEINRVALAIEENGLQNVDLSQCEYVYHIEKCSVDFYDSDSDYSIREIGGELYRFDYAVKTGTNSSRIILAVNIILAVVTAAVFTSLFYIRSKILCPFERITNVPYELSKGNLTIPVKENKSRFFGKFLWGIDLRRENREQPKTREMEPP
nr:sensor histidine kinase [Lachnospiraceae bacterium]